MKIGVYVGSFNPVHKGHIKIVNHLLDNGYLDKVIIIPTGNYWDKTNLISINDRISMLKMYESDCIIIDTKNNYLKYTYLVLEEIKKEYKNDEISLIIGADNIIHFDKWKNYKDIFKYNLIIMNRDNVDVKFYLDKFGKTDKYIVVNDLEKIDISSTMIRDCIREGKVSHLLNYLDKDVLEYIEKQRLYSGGKDAL